MNTLKVAAIGFGLVVCFAGTGCNDKLKAKDAHIALLEDTNQQLTAELAAKQRRLDEFHQERQDLNARLLAAQGQVGQLQSDLNSASQPIITEGWQAVPGGAMIAIEGSVLFASGKATLRDAGKGTLEAIASTIRSKYPEKDVFIIGHTDDTPIRKSGWKDNLELSAQRAMTVVRYMQELGISPKRLVACGAGEHRPRVPNTGDPSRAQNRRVEIYAIDPTG